VRTFCGQGRESIFRNFFMGGPKAVDQNLIVDQRNFRVKYLQSGEKN